MGKKPLAFFQENSIIDVWLDFNSVSESNAQIQTTKRGFSNWGECFEKKFGIGTIWAQKIKQAKSAIISKILNYTSLHAYFCCQKFSIFPLYTLLTGKIDTFWSAGIYTKRSKCFRICTLWCGGICIVWHKKSQTKNQECSQRLL